MALMKKMAAVAVTGSLLFGLVGTAFAADANQIGTAANRLQTLGIVNGMDATGDLQLDQSLTRAQLMKIMVWAYGQKDNAAILKGAVAFPDTATHWASGEIAIAKNIIVEKNHASMGMPDGTFAPEAKLTAAQAVAFMVKFLGIAPTNDAWPANYINAAVNAGLITTADAANIKDVETTRGFAFFLADQAFAAKGANGQSVYTTYVKPTAPVVTAEAAELNTTATKVTVSGSVSKDATTVFVGTPANTITVGADGKFSFDANLVIGANSIVIGATDIVGATTTKTISVTRTVGEAVAIEAPAAITVKAGQTADLAVAVKDVNGAAIAGAPVAVTSTLGTYADGKFTAGTTAGTGVATVTAGGLSVNVNVTVEAGQIATVKVSPATLDLASNKSQKFTATGADQFGNEVALTNAVNWTASKGVMGPDGTFGATADATGTVTVTATSAGISGTATATVFGQAAKVQIAAPAEMVADNASETTVTATVVDAAGNVVKDYNGKVTFTATSSTYVTIETATVDAVNGVASTTIKATNRAGSVVLSATAANVAATTTSYKTVAQTLTNISMAVDPGTINAKAGSKASVKFTMLDQNGNTMLVKPTGTFTVRVSTSDISFATIEGAAYADYTLTAPETTLDYVINGTTKIGSATVSAVLRAPSAFTGIAIGSQNVSSVLVGDADAITVDAINAVDADGTSTVTFRVVDFNGNQLTTNYAVAAADYTVAIKKGSTTVTGPTVSKADVAYGIGTVTVDWSAYAPATGSAGTYTIEISKSGLTKGSQTVTVSPADATTLSLSRNIETLSANGAANSTLTVKVFDDYNNLVTDGSYDVTLTRTGNKVTSAADTQEVTTSNGVATFTVTSTTAVGTDSFVASNEDLTSSSSVNVSTAILGLPNYVAVVDNTLTGTAGTDVDVQVAVKDANTNTLSYLQGTPVTVEVKDGDETVGTFSGTTVNGIATVTVNVTKANADGYTLVATSGSLTKAEEAGALVIEAAAPTAIELSSDLTTLAATATGVDATVTVTLKDEFGNTAVNSTGDVLTVYAQESTTTYGEVTGSALRVSSVDADWYGFVPVTIADGASTGTFTFSSNQKAGSVTISVEGTDLTSDSVSLNSVVTGDADALSLSSISDSVVSNGTKFQTVTVSIVDGAGTVRTQDTGVVVTAAADNGTLDDANMGIFVRQADGTFAAYDAGVNNVTTNGSITFGFTSKDAAELSYSFASGTFTAEATGTFVPGEAASVVVLTSDPASIVGDGVATTGVSAKVVDAFGNTVTGYNGTMTFKISSGNDFGVLQSTTAEIVDGVATVIGRSKLVTSAGTVKVQAGVDINADGVIDYSAATTVFSVTAAPTTDTP